MVQPVVASFEPGEDWFFDYEKQRMIKGVEFAAASFAPSDSAGTRSSGKSPTGLGSSPALIMSEQLNRQLVLEP